MNSISIDSDEAMVVIGNGRIAMTTGANIDTGNNFCLIIHSSERVAKLGDELPENIGLMASDLPSPRIRIEFASSEAVKVFIRQLRRIDRDLRK